jgi:adenosylhomocysteine nucleosidase
VVRSRYLVISATEAEAANVPAGADVVVTGIGKTAAAP